MWELPVRAYHWINAIALVLTLHHRLLDRSADPRVLCAEGDQQYWFGWVRFIHFLVGVRLCVQLSGAPIYWGFVGNSNTMVAPT